MNKIIESMKKVTPHETVRLHPDIILYDLLDKLGDTATARKLSGGYIIEFNDSKFFYGDIITHPSLKNKKMIAA